MIFMHYTYKTLKVLPSFAVSFNVVYRRVEVLVKVLE